MHTSTGGDVTYERLLLATGAEPRRLAVAEESGVPTAYLRTIEDSDRLKAAFADGGRIAVVGAGWIGLEVAAAARTAGCEVTVFETADLPLLRVLGPTVAQAFADLHRAHGVDLRLGTQVSTADLAGADLVVAGVGVTPRVALAEAAGLAVDNGVLVDAGLRTSVPSVLAVGDIANHAHPVLGRRIRVEHWDTAINQAKVAAHNLAGGDEVYDALPYFFTDQYDLGMEYVGNAGADDEVVVHGSLEKLEFRAFWLREGRVVAAMHANDWDATDDLRAAVASGDLPRPRPTMRNTHPGALQGRSEVGISHKSGGGAQGWRASNSASDTASGSASSRTWASSACTTRRAAAARSPQFER